MISNYMFLKIERNLYGISGFFSRTQKKQVMSNHYCTSCSKNYCDDCLHRHDNNPVFKGHQVLDKGSDVAKDVFCKVHSTEQVRLGKGDVGRVRKTGLKICHPKYREKLKSTIIL